jgi:hypothetical protein
MQHDHNNLHNGIYPTNIHIPYMPGISFPARNTAHQPTGPPMQFVCPTVSQNVYQTANVTGTSWLATSAVVRATTKSFDGNRGLVSDYDIYPTARIITEAVSSNNVYNDTDTCDITYRSYSQLWVCYCVAYTNLE